MRGFLSLEPDGATLSRLLAAQNRLRDALTRQGVHFPERLGATLLAWPFGTPDELDAAADTLDVALPAMSLASPRGLPNDDRPAEVGCPLLGAEETQARLYASIRALLDPDPPKPAVVRLARIAPPSRKAGAALRSLGSLGDAVSPFHAGALVLWRQTPLGFEAHRRLPLKGE